MLAVASVLVPAVAPATALAAVSAVSVNPSTSTGGASGVTYSVQFTSSDALPVSGAVYLDTTSAPGVLLPTSPADYLFSDSTATDIVSEQVYASGNSTAIIVPPALGTIPAFQSVTLQILDVTNPSPSTDSTYTLGVWTSADASEGSGSFTISAATGAVAQTPAVDDTFAFSPAPIAVDGSLAAGSQVAVTLTLEGSGGPAAGTLAYLSFAQAAGGGSAAAAGTALTATPEPFTTDANGEIAITYTAPATLPTGGTDTLTAASDNSSSPAVVATDSYTFGTPSPAAPNGSVGPSGGTLATPDGAFTMSLPAGAVPAGGSLSATDACTPPSGLPSHLRAVSCVVTLAGSTLAEPEPATVGLLATALGGLPSDRVAVYRQSSGGGWTFVPTSVATGGNAASFAVPGPETVVALANDLQFTDVAPGYWAAADIDAMLADSVIDGFPNGTFQPGAPLTRAEFVKMLVAALGLPAAAQGTTSFVDVPAGSWFAPYVATAVHNGLAQGTSASTFSPAATLTREALAVLLARALKLNPPSGAGLSFSDASRVDAWAAASVEAAVGAGYMTGFPDHTFEPLGATTRAQAAAVLAKLVAHRAP